MMRSLTTPDAYPVECLHRLPGISRTASLQLQLKWTEFGLSLFHHHCSVYSLREMQVIMKYQFYVLLIAGQAWGDTALEVRPRFTTNKLTDILMIP